MIKATVLIIWFVNKIVKVMRKINTENIAKLNKTLLFEKPKFSNLCEMWSVPPVIGETPDFNLDKTTVIKSISGIEKNSITGGIGKFQKLLISLFHVNNILINPKQYPMNKLPESPIYNLAVGKLKYENPKIEPNNTMQISVNLNWFDV